MSKKLLAGAGVLVLGLSSGAFAEGLTITYPTDLTPASIATGVTAAAGVFLLAVFAATGGFRLAKKAFRWMVGKI